VPTRIEVNLTFDGPFNVGAGAGVAAWLINPSPAMPVACR